MLNVTYACEIKFWDIFSSVGNDCVSAVLWILNSTGLRLGGIRSWVQHVTQYECKLPL